jgi:hypothetical protein
VRQSVGDLSILSASQHDIQYPFFHEDRKRPQLGSHGGLTIEEMIVPLLSINLSKL